MRWWTDMFQFRTIFCISLLILAFSVLAASPSSEQPVNESKNQVLVLKKDITDIINQIKQGGQYSAKTVRKWQNQCDEFSRKEDVFNLSNLKENLLVKLDQQQQQNRAPASEIRDERKNLQEMSRQVEQALRTLDMTSNQNSNDDE